MRKCSVGRDFETQIADRLEVLPVLGDKREPLLDGCRGNQGIEGPQTVRLCMTLEQLVRAAGEASIEVRLHRIGFNEAVDTIGIPLVPGADDELSAVMIEIAISSREST
jgi:hypothetical protein